MEKHKDAPKKKWDIMKEIISKQNCSSYFPQNFVVNGTKTNNQTEIANAFNSYFTKIGPNLAVKIKNPSKPFTEYIQKLDSTLQLNFFNDSEIRDAFKCLKSNKSSKVDGIT